MAHIWNIDIEVNDGKGDEQALFLFHGIGDVFWTDDPDKGFAFLKQELIEHKCITPAPECKLTPDETMTEFNKLDELKKMVEMKASSILIELGWAFQTIPSLEECGLWGKQLEDCVILLDKGMALKYEEENADMKLMEETDA